MEDTSQESYQRRREQVRKAQRTHRARKANYIKSLEDEICELREQNAVYQNESKTHQKTINRLKEFLTSNGLSIPPECIQMPSASANLATINLAGRPFPHQELQAHIPPADTPFQRYDETESSRNSKSPQVISETSQSSVEPSPIPAPASLPPKLSAPPPQNPSSSSAPRPPNTQAVISTQKQQQQQQQQQQQYAHPQGLDSAQVGINFVLALEQPCIYHHKIPFSPELLITGDIGTGHGAMLSTPIMARSPSFSLNPFHFGYPRDARWTVPSAELETLLGFSQDLGLVEEITPVQAWQVIRQHGRFGEMSFEGLGKLGKRLLPMVECIGFGAIIQRPKFEQAMVEAFSSL